MTNTLCLDKNFSTTRLLTNEMPLVNNKSTDKFETTLFLVEGKNRKGEGGLRSQGYFKKSYDDKPLVSIITVVFNGKKYLEETIQSVLSQTYDNVEYIIIDGGSTDGTIEIIKKYEKQVDYWISEKDTGIYDAMNKGISLAQGNIIGLVNADDIIYNDTLKNVAEAFLKNDSVQYTFGTVDLAKENGDIYGYTRPLSEDERKHRLYAEMPFSHQSLYVKQEIYKKVGLYNLEFKLSADYDFILKLIENNYTSIRLEKNVGFFRMGGESGGFKSFIENKNILLSHNINRYIVYKNFIKSSIKLLLRRVLPNSLFLFIKHKFRKKSKHVYVH